MSCSGCGRGRIPRRSSSRSTCPRQCAGRSTGLAGIRADTAALTGGPGGPVRPTSACESARRSPSARACSGSGTTSPSLDRSTAPRHRSVRPGSATSVKASPNADACAGSSSSTSNRSASVPRCGPTGTGWPSCRSSRRSPGAFAPQRPVDRNHALLRVRPRRRAPPSRAAGTRRRTVVVRDHREYQASTRPRPPSATASSPCGDGQIIGQQAFDTASRMRWPGREHPRREVQIERDGLLLAGLEWPRLRHRLAVRAVHTRAGDQPDRAVGRHVAQAREEVRLRRVHRRAQLDAREARGSPAARPAARSRTPGWPRPTGPGPGEARPTIRRPRSPTRGRTRSRCTPGAPPPPPSNPSSRSASVVVRSRSERPAVLQPPRARDRRRRPFPAGTSRGRRRRTAARGRCRCPRPSASGPTSATASWRHSISGPGTASCGHVWFQGPTIARTGTRAPLEHPRARCRGSRRTSRRSATPAPAAARSRGASDAALPERPVALLAQPAEQPRRLRRTARASVSSSSGNSGAPATARSAGRSSPRTRRRAACRRCSGRRP